MTLRSERKRVTFGSTEIEYTVRRSHRRRKTVEIAVDPVDGVRVAAPARATDAEIEDFVRRRARWILRRLDDVRNGAEPLAPREWITGETLLYLGRHYRLRVLDEDGPGERVRLTSRWLEVRAPHPDTRVLRTDDIARAVEQWYRTCAEQKLRERVQMYARRLGVTSARILVRAQAKRWGSCSRDGTLRFNWRIIMAPLSVVDYVVAHELCHLLHPNHGRRFWEALAAIMPDHAVRRELLRREGPRY
ncbi:MAG TPA: SprT family zinc-dependent metalloprotease, partial [Dehalococcoidia bacterium]|nr:SprT family zinc-dependent metalloprotease [Dehalococcoidia bacterium]